MRIPTGFPLSSDHRKQVTRTAKLLDRSPGTELVRLGAPRGTAPRRHAVVRGTNDAMATVCRRIAGKAPALDRKELAFFAYQIPLMGTDFRAILDAPNADREALLTATEQRLQTITGRLG